MDKPRLDEQYVIDEITAICNNLGKLDENDGTYMKDRDCKACLREIQRYLALDSDRHTARCILGSLNIIQSDIIPLIVQYCDYNDGDSDLFTTILRLSTNLTSSVLLLFEKQEIPTDPDLLKKHNQILQGLYGYKKAFADDERVWSTLNVHLRHNDNDEVTFERLIVLIRNILHIPVDSTADMGAHCEFDTHDLCLHRMDKSGMLATILEIASETQKGTEYCFHITEIIYLMLRDQNPRTIASSQPTISKKILDKDDEDKKRLAELSARNRRERQSRNQFVPNRFRSSCFVANNYKTVAGAPMPVKRPISTVGLQGYDSNKTDLRKSKNKKPLSSETFMKISDTRTKSSKISYSLKVFCKQFNEKVYNNYMQQIKHNLIQKKTQDNDESYYLWAIQFFSALNRYLKMSLEHISETLSTSTLHFIQILINGYQDKIKMEKKNFQDISKRLHLGLRAYREVLIILRTIDSGSEYFNTAETIKKNIFNEIEYSTLLVNLFQQYDEPKHSSHYLHDLIHTNHIFLDLLEEYSKTHNPVHFEDDEYMPDSSDDEEKAQQEPVDSEEVQELQASDAVKLDSLIDPLIPNSLHEPLRLDSPIQLPNLEEIVDLDKAGDSSEKIATDDQTRLEIDQIKEEKTETSDLTKNKRKSTGKKKKKRSKKKSEFRTAHFMNRYCGPDVIKCFTSVLKNYRTNEESLNLEILKFLERLVYDCHQELMLFQASLFRCLLSIIDYDSSLPGHDKFLRLSKHLFSDFGTKANKKPWMFQELLFWKTASNAMEIEMAIEPPPVIVPEKPDSEYLEPELPVETVADLMAELVDSDDDLVDDQAAIGLLSDSDSNSPGGKGETVADLMAELADSDDNEPVDQDNDGDVDPLVMPQVGDKIESQSGVQRQPPVDSNESNSRIPDSPDDGESSC